MITLKEKAKISNIAMSILKASEVREVIAHTNKGDLCLVLPFKGSSDDFKFVLDAVPLSIEENAKLFALYNDVIFKIK